MHRVTFFLWIVLFVLLLPSKRGMTAEANPCESLAPMPEPLYGIVKQAEKLADSGDLKGALSILKNWLAENPESVHAYPCYDIGYFFWQMKKYSEAVPFLRKAVERDPCFSDAWQLLAVVYHETGDAASAASALEKAAKIKNDAVMWYQVGLIKLEGGDPDGALKALKKVPSENRKTSDWYVAVARAQDELKQPGPAAEAMASAYRISNDPVHLYQSALFRMEAKEPQKALPLLKKLAERPSPRTEWLTTLSAAEKALKNRKETAEAMERAARRSRDPNLSYHAACLWIEADESERALILLKKLAERKRPRVEWLLALSDTFMILNKPRPAAKTMERVASMSPKPKYQYHAGVLWIQAGDPDRALHFLIPLSRKAHPKPRWLVGLSHARVLKKDYVKASTAMEQAANITRKGADYYRAGMLWLQAGDRDKCIELLRQSVAQKPVLEKWRVSLAMVLFNSGRKTEAERVMAETDLMDKKVPPDIRYRGAVIWVWLEQNRKALPVLKALCSDEKPQKEWLIALVKTRVAVQQITRAQKDLNGLLALYPEDSEVWRLAVWLSLLKNELPQAAAAMAVAVRLGPPDKKQLKDLADLYMAAGVPQKAAMALKKTWKGAPNANDWDRLARIYLSGHWYNLALKCAETALAKEETAARWRTVGDIAFRLQKFEKSLNAYKHSIALKPTAEALLGAGYAALKMDKMDRAFHFFSKVEAFSKKDSATVREARNNMAYIKKMKAVFKGTSAVLLLNEG